MDFIGMIVLGIIGIYATIRGTVLLIRVINGGARAVETGVVKIMNKKPQQKNIEAS